MRLTSSYLQQKVAHIPTHSPGSWQITTTDPKTPVDARLVPQVADALNVQLLKKVSGINASLPDYLVLLLHFTRGVSCHRKAKSPKLQGQGMRL